MRWKQIETGDKKIIKRFAFFPITIGNETRWSEWCIIETFQYDGDLKGKDGYYVPEWVVEAFENGIMYYGTLNQDEPPCKLFIETLEGKYYVNVGDYVIKGIKGELYPCKPDIFEESYEPVN